MSGAAKNTTPGQGAGVDNKAGANGANGTPGVNGVKTVDHVVTQVDLDSNPELVAEGVKVGDTIQIPAEAEELKSKISIDIPEPEFINEFSALLEKSIASNEALVASNQAVIASNEAMAESIKDFREGCSEIVEEVVKQGKAIASGEIEKVISKPIILNPDATYVVKAGKKFQDGDTGNYHEAGADVSDLHPDRLKNLLGQGIIEESTTEESETQE